MRRVQEKPDERSLGIDVDAFELPSLRPIRSGGVGRQGAYLIRGLFEAICTRAPTLRANTQ